MAKKHYLLDREDVAYYFSVIGGGVLLDAHYAFT